MIVFIVMFVLIGFVVVLGVGMVMLVIVLGVIGVFE